MPIQKVFKLKYHDFLCKIVVFLAVFIASANGLELFGLSGNKLCLIPLEMYLIFYASTRYQRFLIPTAFLPLLLYHILQIVNSTIGLCNNDLVQYIDYSSTMIFNILQCSIIYIPLIISVAFYPNKKKLWNIFLNCLVLTVRIQCIWAIVQFVLWYVFLIDFNELVFSDLFHGFFGEAFTSKWMWANNATNLKITGINHDAAFLSEAMLVGTCLDKRKIFKLFYFLVCVFALSRVGVIAHIALYGYQFIRYFCICGTSAKISPLKFLITAVVVCAFLVAVVYVYRKFSFIDHLLESLLYKMTTISLYDDTYGTSRHVMYPLYCWGCWLLDLNIVQKFIGIGSRASGLAFVTSSSYSSTFAFSSGMLTTSWDTECEISAMLLGNGIAGLLIYFKVLKDLIASKREEFVLLAISFFVYGFMYNMFTATFGQLISIFIIMEIYETKHNVVNGGHKLSLSLKACR